MKDFRRFTEPGTVFRSASCQQDISVVSRSAYSQLFPQPINHVIPASHTDLKCDSIFLRFFHNLSTLGTACIPIRHPVICGATLIPFPLSLPSSVSGSFHVGYGSAQLCWEAILPALFSVIRPWGSWWPLPDAGPEDFFRLTIYHLPRILQDMHSESKVSTAEFIRSFVERLSVRCPKLSRHTCPSTACIPILSQPLPTDSTI